MSFIIKNNVFWVGKVDWELRRFHGEELSTHRGSSYNSYLIREEKTVLIDTVWRPYAREFIENLKKEIDLNEIDAIIVNHGEVDHSGALPELMKLIPDTPIYCTANGVKSLKGQYHQDWNFKVVKTGDRLNLGSKELIFIEAPMLHWPDSMFTYLTGDNILFSNDAFGQHYAHEPMFNDQVDECELYQEALKYYANILTPFSKMVLKKIDEVLGMDLSVSMICPSHGIIWRKDPLQIVNTYKKWADEYQENQITILYDTMWKGTKYMAEAIAEGIRNKDKDVTIKLYRTSTSDKNDVITEVFKSKAILVGSPTVNNGILTTVAGIMEEIHGMRFKGKKAAAFGCYGWSGESMKILTEMLEKAGFEIVQDGIRVNWSPNKEDIERCIKFGESFVENL
ncbi:MBL fold hydrolase [Anoxybacter fermentans]|uniref:MBL fold hydrolase n=1 Tax=Anoxybacter fermentans TaxID=1323375 RepID=A0A3S9SUJ2_9FIRM|nr:anaerobic nitric oxide reductase flavorubredoxin [Anoxybacter fermentans]AZR71971.1 MBL fold hydrolase [Anoxybacter fermentans]